MSDKIANTQDRPEEKPLTEQELQFCNLYVNGGLEYAGRPKKCFVEVFGEDTVKNPYASANYLMNKPHVLAHIKALLSSERFEMETMAVKLHLGILPVLAVAVLQQQPGIFLWDIPRQSKPAVKAIVSQFDSILPIGFDTP